MGNSQSKRWRQWFGCASLTALLGWGSATAGESLAIVGRDGWLFLRTENRLPTDKVGIAESIGLIRKFNQLLADSGISLVVTMVPVKMRIYQEHLPADIVLSPEMQGQYDRLSQELQKAGVSTIDLNTPFLSSPQRLADDPLYYRLDGHWSFAGVRLAAATVRSTLENNPKLKKVWSEIPVAGYEQKISKRKRMSRARDLTTLLPPGAGPFAMEYFSPSSINRLQPIDEKNKPPVGIAVQGSSFSQDWSGFVDNLRYELQRDILNDSIPASIGAWYGMETYLRSDAFQNQPPKIIIWERPEYTLRAPPDFKYQDARYVSNNKEWLTRVAAWVQRDCKPAAAKPRVVKRGLAAHVDVGAGEHLDAGPTQSGEALEIEFDRPLTASNYLSGKVVANGVNGLTFEAITPNGGAQRFVTPVAGDASAHALKVTLPSGDGRGYVKLRLYPGKSDNFSLRELKICNLPDGLLK